MESCDVRLDPVLSDCREVQSWDEPFSEAPTSPQRQVDRVVDQLYDEEDLTVGLPRLVDGLQLTV
jgi:hypothetical protein